MGTQAPLSPLPLLFFHLLPSPTDKQRDQVFLNRRSWGWGDKGEEWGRDAFWTNDKGLLARSLSG